jgi:hypothetical protein
VDEDSEDEEEDTEVDLRETGLCGEAALAGAVERSAGSGATKGPAGSGGLSASPASCIARERGLTGRGALAAPGVGARTTWSLGGGGPGGVCGDGLLGGAADAGRGGDGGGGRRGATACTGGAEEWARGSPRRSSL